MNLGSRIELYLLDRPDWVPVREICEHFEIEERILRADGHRRPLCRTFAISCSTRGLKHLRYSSPRERIAYKHARLKVGIAYFRAVREFDEAIGLQVTGNPAFEALTGQRLLFKL